MRNVCCKPFQVVSADEKTSRSKKHANPFDRLNAICNKQVMGNGRDINPTLSPEAEMAANLLNSVPAQSTIKIGDLVDCLGAVGWSGCARVVEGPLIGAPDLVWIQETVRLDGETFRFRGLWPISKLRKL